MDKSRIKFTDCDTFEELQEILPTHIQGTILNVFFHVKIFPELGSPFIRIE